MVYAKSESISHADLKALPHASLKALPDANMGNKFERFFESSGLTMEMRKEELIVRGEEENINNLEKIFGEDGIKFRTVFKSPCG